GPLRLPHVINDEAMRNVELRNRSAISQIERILQIRVVIDDDVENVGTIVDGFRPGIRDLELMTPRESFVQLNGECVIVGDAGSFDQRYCIESWIYSVAASRYRTGRSIKNALELWYARNLVSFICCRRDGSLGDHIHGPATQQIMAHRADIAGTQCQRAR